MEISQPFWGRYKWIATLAVIGIFILGLGIRLYDLTDPPLDAAYRQLHSAIIARGMYYQMLPSADPTLRQTAIYLWHYEDTFEPPIFERIVAVTYLITGEHLWIPRLYAILFWMIGGLALFSLARKITSQEGAIVALAFYLILPFGVILSRRFQPDPFMVMWVIVSAYALYNWQEKRDLKSAIWAGLACAAAVTVKVFAVFFIAPMAIAMVLVSGNLQKSIRNLQIWLMAAIMIAIPAIIYLVFRRGAQGYLEFWSTEFIGLLTQPAFYVRWWNLLDFLLGGLAIIIGLAGVVIAQPKARALLISLWLGYLVFGFFEPWQIHTHDYYSLILVPIVGLSIGSVAAAFFTRLAQQASIWKFIFSGVALFALVMPAWNVRVELAAKDSRINFAAWTTIGKSIPTQGKMIALTDDYGTYVEYFGWRTVKLWPTTADLNLMVARGGNNEPEFQKYFAEETRDMDYFLVTAFYELDNQTALRDYLYSHFSYTKGDDYLLFDLHSTSATP